MSICVHNLPPPPNDQPARGQIIGGGVSLPDVSVRDDHLLFLDSSGTERSRSKCLSSGGTLRLVSAFGDEIHLSDHSHSADRSHSVLVVQVVGDLVSRLTEAGSRRQEAGSRKQGAGSREQGAGSRNQRLVGRLMERQPRLPRQARVSLAR